MEKRKQATIYQTQEDIKRVRRLKAVRLLLGQATTNSDIYSEAVRNMHDKEFKTSRENL